MPPPKIVGYSQLSELGQGGFAVVYRAVNEATGQHVAVKVLTAPGGDAQARFGREVQILRRLAGNPNIVPVHDVGHTADGRTYLTMPLLLGGTLQDRIDGTGPQPWRPLAQVGAVIAHALTAAHRAGVLHRDVKPDNILFAQDGTPYLADFGIARLTDASALLTRSGQISATVAYAPVEILEGHAPSPASDVYSLAATLVAAIRGRPAFVDGSPSIPALIARVATQPPPDLTAFGIPARLQHVLFAGMAKRPEDRIQDPQELVKALRWALTQAQPAAVTAPLLPPRHLEDLDRRRAPVASKPRRKVARAVTGVALVGVFSLAAVVAAGTRGDDRRDEPEGARQDQASTTSGDGITFRPPEPIEPDLATSESDPSGSSPAPTGDDASRPEPPAEPRASDGAEPTAVAVNDARVGQCVDLPGGGAVREFVLRDCNDPHDAEVAFLGGYDDRPGSAYPTADRLTQVAQEQCPTAVRDYVGSTQTQATVVAAAVQPSPETWANGDRALICLVRDGNQNKITGSVRDR